MTESRSCHYLMQRSLVIAYLHGMSPLRYPPLLLLMKLCPNNLLQESIPLILNEWCYSRTRNYRLSLLAPFLEPDNYSSCRQLMDQLKKNLTLMRFQNDLLFQQWEGLELPLPHVLTEAVCKILQRLSEVQILYCLLRLRLLLYHFEGC